MTGQTLKTPLLVMLLCLSGSYIHADDQIKNLHEQPVRLVADEWCPQHCQNNPKHKGYIVDIVERALETENVAYQLTYLPWLRAMALTQGGKYDALLTPLKNEFPEAIFNAETVGDQEYCIYTLNTDNWTYSKPSDFDGRQVAYLSSSGIGDLQHYFDNTDKVAVQTFPGGDDYVTQLFNFLKTQRTNSVIITSDVYGFSVKEKIIDDSYRSAGCLGHNYLHVALSPADRDRSMLIADLLDAGIRKLRESGELNLILERYGLRK